MESSHIAVLDTIHQVAWTVADAGDVDWLNQEWYAYTGQRQSLRANPKNLTWRWLAAIHRDDQHRSQQALRDGIKSGITFELELRLRRGDGVANWFRARVSRLDDARNRSKRWVAICTNIDTYKRQGQRLAFIAKAGEMLAESLDLQGTLNRLLALIVPKFGDWAAIDLLDENDRARTVAVIHADPSKTRLVERLQKGRAVSRELGPRAAAIVPLRTRRRTIGSLVVCWSETSQQYDEEDRSLFEALTKPAALSIENARLLERERAVAAEFQRAALPIALPEIAGVRFSGIYVPANDRESLGGDWYDALRLGDGRVVVSIGDVAGSGLAAAVIMSSMRQVIRGVAQVHADPIAMLDAADRTLKTEHPDTLVSAFVGVFDPVARTLTYDSAGHPCPLLRDSCGAVTVLGTSGLPLGLRARRDTALTTALEGFSLVVFYSNGLIEAKRDIVGNYDRLLAAIARPEILKNSNPAEALYRAILKRGNTDDVVVLTLRLGATPKVGRRAAGKRRSGRWTFNTSDVNAAHDSRHSFVAALSKRGVYGEYLDAAELVFGELLGNVARYAPGPIEIIFDWAEGAPVLHVLDRGPGFKLTPKLPSDLLSEQGRGLYIVSLLAEDFNVTERYDGGSHARAVLNTGSFGVGV